MEVIFRFVVILLPAILSGCSSLARSCGDGRPFGSTRAKFHQIAHESNPLLALLTIPDIPIAMYIDSAFEVIPGPVDSNRKHRGWFRRRERKAVAPASSGAQEESVGTATKSEAKPHENGDTESGR